jgi:hypothetical protein
MVAPPTEAARDRLRAQVRREQELADGVLAAEARLHNAIAKADALLAAQQRVIDERRDRVADALIAYGRRSRRRARSRCDHPRPTQTGTRTNPQAPTHVKLSAVTSEAASPRTRGPAGCRAGGYRDDVQWSVETARTLACEKLSNQDDRWAHVRGVGALAEKLVAELGRDDRLASAAWLHDIGYSESVAQTGFHPLDGVRLLASLSAPAEVVSLVAYHSGSEREAEERGLTDELAHFDRPSQSDLDALTFADMTTSHQGAPISVDQRINEILDRYPPDSPVHRAVARCRTYLVECVTRTQERLAATR